MARQTVLTEVQKARILVLAAQGLTPYAIGKEMELPATTVSRHVSAAAKIKKAATDIVRIEKEVSTYSIPEQSATMDILAGLRAISNNLTRAAVIGSENSARLHTIAKMRLDTATIDPENVDLEAARDVVGFTRAANDASALGVQLLNANKEQMAALPEPAPAFDVTRLSPQALSELMALRNENNRS